MKVLELIATGLKLEPLAPKVAVGVKEKLQQANKRWRELNKGTPPARHLHGRPGGGICTVWWNELCRSTQILTPTRKTEVEQR